MVNKPRPKLNIRAPRWTQFSPTDEQIRHSLHMQTMARLKPESIRYPDNFTPFAALDKLVIRNMIMDWPIKKIMETFPSVSISFVARAKQRKAKINSKE